jgi:hypothetical protein
MMQRYSYYLHLTGNDNNLVTIVIIWGNNNLSLFSDALKIRWYDLHSEVD